MNTTMVIAIQRTLQAGILIEMVVILAICVGLLIKRPGARLYVYLPLLWSLYGFTLFGMLLSGVFVPEQLRPLLGPIWALSTVTLVLVGMVVFLWKPKRRAGEVEGSAGVVEGVE